MTPYVHSIYIRTTPERLWRALTEPEFTRDYYFDSRVRSDWQVGSPVVYEDDQGTALIAGEVVEAIPGKRLALRVRYLWDPKLAEEPPHRLVFEIEQQGDTCHLVVIQDETDDASESRRQTAGGLPFIVSGLKTLLETGTPMGARA